MKKTLLFIFALILTIGQSFAQTVATLPFYEGFNYTAGADYAAGVKLTPTGTAANTTATNGLWVYGAAVASSDPVLVPSTWANSKGLPAVTGSAIQFKGGTDDPVIKIPTQSDLSSGMAEATIYASFLMKINDWALVVSNTASDYFFGFAKGTFPGTSFNHTSAVYYKRNALNTNFNLGVAETNNTSRASFDSQEYSLGQEILVVIAYKYTELEGTSYMWINPGNGTIPSVEPASTVNTLITDNLVLNPTFTGIRNILDKVRINKNGNTTTPDITIDEIRIGNTWLEVTTNNPTASVNNVLASKLNIYPNPAKDYITVESKSVKISSVAMYNILGAQVISEKALDNNRLNVSGLAKGIYMLKINAEGGSATKKVVIE